MLLARCKHSAAKHLLQEARDAQNLHEITDLLLDETPRDSRERLKPTQINRVVRAHRCRGVNRDRSQAAGRRGGGARREGEDRDV